jgi:predicted nuclease of restriction endonuclease-like RecB superfamily
LTNRCTEEVIQLPDTEPGSRLSTELNRISEIARENPTARFTSLAHLLDEECLMSSYQELNPQAVAGVDPVTYKAYGP